MHPVFVELLGNLQWMSLQEANTPAEIIVCLTQSGKAAHAPHIDCKPTLYGLSKRGSPHLTVVFFYGLRQSSEGSLLHLAGQADDVSLEYPDPAAIHGGLEEDQTRLP